MTDKQIIIDKLKNDIACKENIINHLAEYSIKLEKQLKAKEQECEELKQTLIEIKEIAKKAKKDICNNCGWRNTDSCDPEDYTCREFIKILQKISEVEEQC